MLHRNLILMIGVSVLTIAGCAPESIEQRRSAQSPSQVPPASFAGQQFVDRDGCVFIRAGAPRALKWVPRVSRDGEQICGAEPTFPTVATKTDT